MAKVELKRFGTVLTGRPFGAQTYAELKKEFGQEKVEFDFSGVSSMGSSFGEEVMVPFAREQGDVIKVWAANKPVKNCIDLIVSDFNIRVEYL